uniref:Uncharacterized protein n=1 Tax=Oryza nivara TaxID=4536 RepID=A0A0E0G4N5_ORYNI
MGDGVDAVGGGVGSTVGASYDAGCLEMRLAIVRCRQRRRYMRAREIPHNFRIRSAVAAAAAAAASATATAGSFFPIPS